MFNRRRPLRSIAIVRILLGFIWILSHLLFSDLTKPDDVNLKQSFQESNKLERHGVNSGLYSKRGSRNDDLTQTCASVPALPEIPDKMFDHHLIANQPLNLLYCFVPKVACTFWKRAFYFIQRHQEGDPLGSFFDIGKNDIHKCHIHKLHSIRKSFIGKYSFINGATKMIIVREPYARLFSASVDKLFLLDFWPYVGVKILKRYRENPDVLSLKCGHDVTFEEFLKYVVHIGYSTTFTLEEFDDHWLPISRPCQSCQVDYDVIAKLEDFAHSRDAILSLTGMDRYIPTNVTDKDTDLDLMWLNIEAYWDVVSEVCRSLETIMNRLWTSFQYQGFLPGDASFPLVAMMENGDPSKEKFFQYVSRLHSEFSLNNPKSKGSQRKDFMLKAYKGKPRNLLNDIKQLFHLDFVLYGYDPKPVDIFS